MCFCHLNLNPSLCLYLTSDLRQLFTFSSSSHSRVETKNIETEETTQHTEVNNDEMIIQLDTRRVEFNIHQFGEILNVWHLDIRLHMLSVVLLTFSNYFQGKQTKNVKYKEKPMVKIILIHCSHTCFCNSWQK